MRPGLRESPYEESLATEFSAARLSYIRQPRIEGTYKGRSLDLIFRPDFIVEDEVIVELKAAKMITSNDKAQVLTYLRLTNCPIGLIINFHEERLADGIKRLILTEGYRGPPCSRCSPCPPSQK